MTTNNETTSYSATLLSMLLVVFGFLFMLAGLLSGFATVLSVVVGISGLVAVVVGIGISLIYGD